MTLEEKLKNFYDISVENAAADSRAELETYKAMLDRSFEEHKAVKQQQALASEDEERTVIERDLNKEFSEHQVELRQKLAAKQNEIREQLFETAHAKLTDFKKQPEYVDFLVEKIKAAAAFAGNDAFTIYIDPSDEALLPVLVKKTGVTPVISRPGEEFEGGLRAVVPARHVLMDNSFKYRLAEIKDSYTLD